MQITYPSTTANAVYGNGNENENHISVVSKAKSGQWDEQCEDDQAQLTIYPDDQCKSI